MFSQAIRSLIVLQIVLLLAPLVKQTVPEFVKRQIVVRIGLFLCIVGLIFVDVRLLPEIFGAMLVLLNYVLIYRGCFSAYQISARCHYVLSASLIVFLVSFVMRSGVVDYIFTQQCERKSAVSQAKDSSDSSNLKNICMEDVDRKVKIVCEHMYGMGSYERAQVKKSESDSAYCYALFLPNGTNCQIKVLKANGSVFSCKE